MKICVEKPLKDFSFYGTSRYITDKLTDDEFSKIDEYLGRIFKYALTFEEINNLFNNKFTDVILAQVGLTIKDIENRYD